MHCVTAVTIIAGSPPSPVSTGEDIALGVEASHDALPDLPDHQPGSLSVNVDALVGVPVRTDRPLPGLSASRRKTGPWGQTWLGQTSAAAGGFNPLRSEHQGPAELPTRRTGPEAQQQLAADAVAALLRCSNSQAPSCGSTSPEEDRGPTLHRQAVETVQSSAAGLLAFVKSRERLLVG